MSKDMDQLSRRLHQLQGPRATARGSHVHLAPDVRVHRDPRYEPFCHARGGLQDSPTKALRDLAPTDELPKDAR